MYYKIVIKPQPKEHETGPWYPKTITDSKKMAVFGLKMATYMMSMEILSPI